MCSTASVVYSHCNATILFFTSCNMPILSVIVKNANISCNFEVGFCGWGNDNTNRQKWLLNSGSTKSARTGPTNDNTFGTREGRNLSFLVSTKCVSKLPTTGVIFRLSL